MEFQAILEREKEIYKQRLMEIEHKAKTSESKRSALVFEFEKEKAKWSLEKDNLIIEIESLTDSLKKSKRKREAIIKTNEKLKYDKKNKNRYNSQYTYSSVLPQTAENGNISTKRIELTLSDKKDSKFGKVRSSRKLNKYGGEYSVQNSLNKLK